MAADLQPGEVPAPPTPADPAPQASCPPGWAYPANLLGLGGSLLILVGEMLETGRWQQLMVPCLFIVLLMLQFVAFWLVSRGRAPAAPVPRDRQDT
ncbi:MAG TPA: hypothetical protein VH643_41275 [Gemmataceae bacterium]|jgi:hypothetical protein